MANLKDDGLPIDVFKKGLKKDESGSDEPRLYFYIDGKNKDLMNIGYGFHFKQWSTFLTNFRKFGVVNFDWNPNYDWKGSKPTHKPTLEHDVYKDFICVRDNNYTADVAMVYTKTRARSSDIEKMFEELFMSYQREAENWYNDNSDITLSNGIVVYGLWKDLPEKIRWVLIDMNYNGGIELLKVFKSLKLALKTGDLIAASFECRFKEYIGQGGVTRRNNKRSNYILFYHELSNRDGVLA